MLPVGLCKRKMTNVHPKLTINPRTLKRKIVHVHLAGGWGQSDPPPSSLSTFDTIHPIDMKFGTYNELPLYFQSSVVMWFLIGFHGNHSYLKDVTSGRTFFVLN